MMTFNDSFGITISERETAVTVQNLKLFINYTKNIDFIYR